MVDVQAARHALVPTPVGELMVVADGDAVIGIYFPGHRYPPHENSIGPLVPAADDPVLDAAGRQLREYLNGERDSFSLTVATSGDDLQERVWALLRLIPRGETTTYGALAERLGNKSLAQAVGQAVGHNPISIVIPCHRVVGHDGRLTGFAGGLRRKQFLLELEEPQSVRESRLF